MTRLNVGCGRTPTPGWKNYDNSWSVRLAKRPLITLLLAKTGLLKDWQNDFISDVRRLGIQWANVTRRIPEPDRSVEVLYSSHMIEHLYKEEVMWFLNEARRVLVPGGIIRLAVPDIRYHVEKYMQNKDADAFISSTLLTRDRPKALVDKLKYIFIGDRHHLWMYDGESLCKLLAVAGFQNPQVREPGDTVIKEPGELNLRERSPESVFIEAVNP